MEGELIFVNIDPVFNIALKAVEELQGQGRLVEMNRQKAWLEEIKSADNTFTFGGDGTPPQQAFQFGKTASAVFRMVMLHAVGIGNFGPNFGTAQQRNRPPALQFEVSGQFEVFELLEGVNANEGTARRFCTEYDHVFPRSLITNEVLENQGNSVPFRNTMLIFRNNFTEVIEIITEANATMYPADQNGEFRSSVKVTCIRKKISPAGGGDGDESSDNEEGGDGAQGGDGRWFKLLKTITEKKDEASLLDGINKLSFITNSKKQWRRLLF